KAGRLIACRIALFPALVMNVLIYADSIASVLISFSSSIELRRNADQYCKCKSGKCIHNNSSAHIDGRQGKTVAATRNGIEMKRAQCRPVRRRCIYLSRNAARISITYGLLRRLGPTSAKDQTDAGRKEEVRRTLMRRN